MGLASSDRRLSFDSMLVSVNTGGALVIHPMLGSGQVETSQRVAENPAAICKLCPLAFCCVSFLILWYGAPLNGRYSLPVLLMNSDFLIPALCFKFFPRTVFHMFHNPSAIVNASGGYG